MSDYTPDLDLLRASYADKCEYLHPGTYEAAAAKFDRAISAHLRREFEKAADAFDLDDLATETRMMDDGHLSTFLNTNAEAREAVKAWLRAYASRPEAV